MKTSLEQHSATVYEACVDRNPRAGFWRRLAAAWIDAFVIYAFCALPITLAAIVRIRIAIEPFLSQSAWLTAPYCLPKGGKRWERR